MLATYGLPALVAPEFEDIENTDAVLLFGSWAVGGVVDRIAIRRADDEYVDVVRCPTWFAEVAGERVEWSIGMPVQATVRSRSQWTAERDGFVREVKSRPLVVVLGRPPDVHS